MKILQLYFNHSLPGHLLTHFSSDPSGQSFLRSQICVALRQMEVPGHRTEGLVHGGEVVG